VSILKPKFLQNWIEIYKKGGFKVLMKEKGWKVVAVFFLYYLVRDSILYILIPWIGYSHFSSCY